MNAIRYIRLKASALQFGRDYYTGHFMRAYTAEGDEVLVSFSFKPVVTRESDGRYLVGVSGKRGHVRVEFVDGEEITGDVETQDEEIEEGEHPSVTVPHPASI